MNNILDLGYAFVAVDEENKVLSPDFLTYSEARKWLKENKPKKNHEPDDFSIPYKSTILRALRQRYPNDYFEGWVLKLVDNVYSYASRNACTQGLNSGAIVIYKREIDALRCNQFRVSKYRAVHVSYNKGELHIIKGE